MRAKGFQSLREPIPLPQRLRLLGAAERVERVGGDAGAVLGPAVVPTKSLVVSGERRLAGANASVGWPLMRSKRDRLERARLVSGCSGPSAFPPIASARS